MHQDPSNFVDLLPTHNLCISMHNKKTMKQIIVHSIIGRKCEPFNFLNVHDQVMTLNKSKAA